MANLSHIKWYAERLHELLSEKEYENDPILHTLPNELESKILNTTRFKNIVAAPPVEN